MAIPTKDRFDLEDDINSCWNITTDVKELAERLLDGHPNVSDLTDDELANILIGLNSLYNMKFQRLFDTFCQVLKLDVYGPFGELYDENLNRYYASRKRNDSECSDSVPEYTESPYAQDG